MRANTSMLRAVMAAISRSIVSATGKRLAMVTRPLSVMAVLAKVGLLRRLLLEIFVCDGRLSFVEPAARRGFFTRAARQHRLQILPGVALFHLHDVVGRARRNDRPTAIAAFGAKVDDPVG